MRYLSARRLWPQLRRYGIAVVATAVLLAAVAWPAFPNSAWYPLALGLVAVIAWFGRLGPALVSIACIAASSLFLMGSPAPQSVSWQQTAGATLLLASVAVLLSSLASGRRRTQDAIRRRVRQQAAMADLGQQALAGTELQGLMDQAAMQLAEALAVDYVQVLELTADRNIFRLRAGAGWPQGLVGRVTVSAGPGSQAGHTLSAREPVIVRELGTESRFRDASLLNDHRVTSGISVVIAGEGEPFGVLAAHTIAAREFTPDDQYFVQAVATLLSTAIARHAAERRVRQRFAEMEAIADLSTAVGRADGLDSIFHKALEAVQRTVDADRAAALLFDRDGVMRFWSWLGISETYRRAVEGHSPWAPDQGPFLPVLIPDIAVEPVAAHLRTTILHEGIRAIGFIPIISRRRLLGQLTVYYDEPHQFSPEEVRLAQTIASHVAYAVERCQAEHAIRQSEEELRFALHAARLETWNWDVRAGTMRWSSGLGVEGGRAPAGFTGTLDEYLGHVHPDDREAVRASLSRALEGGTDYQATYRTVPLGDGVRWIEATGRVFHDERHEPVRMAGVIVDVTERRRAEEDRARLLAAEQTARTEAEAAQRRASFLAEASAVLNASLEYERTLGNLAQLAVPEIADWCAVDILDEGQIRRLAVAHIDAAKIQWAHELHRRHPPDLDAPFGIPKVLRTGQSEFYPDVSDAQIAQAARDAEEVALLRAVGIRSAMVVPLAARRRTFGVITFVTAESNRRYTAHDLVMAEDLARRAALAADNARLYNETQEVSRAKDDFLATVSHELRTPLNAILGWASLLRSGGLDAAGGQRALETIERNARAQAQLVSDVLDVSRIITGKLGLNVRPVDLAPVVEAAIDSVRPAADAKEMHLEAALDPEAGPVWGDPDRLQQVAWNLLSNAIKFTPSGGRVEVRLTRGDQSVEIAVQDSGQGIKPDFLPHVFERFRQADASSTRMHGGLGLGLSIVRHLVELHGGTVRTESEGEGRGATFAVRLPLMPAHLESERPERAPAVMEPVALPTATALPRVRILAVDDERDTRELVDTILSSSGAEVRTAASAAEAYEILGYWRPDVLLLDVEMPSEDGYALLRRIRSQQPQHAHVPAIALTAHARPADRARALEAGFQIHVAKPVTPDELVGVVASLLQQSSTTCVDVPARSD